jgi:RecJ-like exonuclease
MLKLNENKISLFLIIIAMLLLIVSSGNCDEEESEWGTGEMECQSCSGTGKILIKCPWCKGIGAIEKTITKECPTCEGEGQVLGECGMCDGRGESLTGNICHHCGGTKEAYIFCPTCDFEMTIEEKIKENCTKCYTSGQIEVECPDCTGLGEIEVEK